MHDFDRENLTKKPVKKCCYPPLKYPKFSARFARKSKHPKNAVKPVSFLINNAPNDPKNAVNKLPPLPNQVNYAPPYYVVQAVITDDLD